MKKRRTWTEPVIVLAPSDALEHSDRVGLDRSSVATSGDDLVDPQEAARRFRGGLKCVMKRVRWQPCRLNRRDRSGGVDASGFLPGAMSGAQRQKRVKPVNTCVLCKG